MKNYVLQFSDILNNLIILFLNNLTISELCATGRKGQLAKILSLLYYSSQ